MSIKLLETRMLMKITLINNQAYTKELELGGDRTKQSIVSYFQDNKDKYYNLNEQIWFPIDKIANIEFIPMYQCQDCPYYYVECRYGYEPIYKCRVKLNYEFDKEDIEVWQTCRVREEQEND